MKELPSYDYDLAARIEHLKSVKDLPDEYWPRFEVFVQRLQESQKNLDSSAIPIVLWPIWKKVGLVSITVFLGISANDSGNWLAIIAFLYYAFLSIKLIVETIMANREQRSSAQKPNNKEERREYYEIGLEYLRNNDYKNAINNFTKAIEITPGVSGLYLAQGNCKMFLKDYQGAIYDFTKAIELSPKEADAYFQRAIARQDLDGCMGDEAANDVRQAADLGDKAAIEWVITHQKDRIKDWTNSLLKDKEGFNMDESSDQYKNLAYHDSDDENNNEWIHKFLDIAAECFISSRNETREELAKDRLATVYSDFSIYLLEFPFIESRAILKAFAPNLDIDIYDRLLFSLVGSELNDKWPEFYNTRLYDMHNKRGKGLATLEAG